ncbi:serpin family protein [Streptomyces sp. NBC_01565]|uniref:serpin family protein n=2 Tax=unclassified Streptomyces TaxID=2593676 RepID=UPI00224E27CB|nr:serpin family protein [Streptomyces sp. NBC_01565]MCX4539707.1 proteinase inhibitor I4 serpin [Streptomyces sp. NBC_01565]
MDNTTVRAVNRLTARWAGRTVTGERDSVLTAAGVWPLLALLADGAGGPAREELAGALGIPAGSAAKAARELLGALAGVRGLQAATGLWAKAGLALEERWLAELPQGARGELSGDTEADTKSLDAWASERTGGLIEKMPVELGEETLLVLASALALRLTWADTFTEWAGPAYDGPWAGKPLRWLHRTTAALEDVRVTDGASGPVTLLRVAGADEVDVHLVLGPAASPPGEVLAAGIAAVEGAVPAADGTTLPEGTPGPGLTIRTVDSYSPRPVLRVRTPAFSLLVEHDLLEHAGLFGLESASGAEGDHFPGVSRLPLVIGSARQAAMARFHATGFEAAAVTAIAAQPRGGMPRAGHRARHAEAAFTSPFGFLAVHRTSRLVLAAGWVADPDADPDRVSG